MSVSSGNSEGTQLNLEGGGAAPPMDTSNLGTIVQEWRRLETEICEHKQMVREKVKQLKVLEGIIMNIMKQNAIGALNLQSSGGRILYKQSNTKEALAPKTLERLLTEHFQSAEKAAEALRFIQEHRSLKTTAKIKYERDE
jgi:hypothetical protein